KVRALEQYSATCQRELTPRLERYVASFQKSGRYTSRQSLQQSMKEQILPPLVSYVTALQQLRPQTPQLQQIHQSLTSAYTQWLGTLEAFTKSLDSDAGWVKSAVGLRHKAQALERAEEQYQTQLKQYARSPTRRR
ncbi:MAG: hypothetical protein KDA51_06730, partial [Planctomycetales bacterium]|nr:hypothetical protein [Planctomycetales bacterium]